MIRTFRVSIYEELPDGLIGRAVVSEGGVEGFVFCGVSGIHTQSHSDRVQVDNCRCVVDGTALGSLQAFVALYAQMMAHDAVRDEVARSQEAGLTFVNKPEPAVGAADFGTDPPAVYVDRQKQEPDYFEIETPHGKIRMSNSAGSLAVCQCPSDAETVDASKPCPKCGLPYFKMALAPPSDAAKLNASIVRLSECLTDVPKIMAADIANVLAELKKHVTFPPEAM